MKKSTKLALAFVALAGAVGSTAYADNNAGGGMRDAMTMRLSRTMGDPDGAIGFDQFSDAVETRLRKLATDKGGRLTVAELAEALEKVG